MKGTVFSVALNHRSQLDAWDQAFHQPAVSDPAQNPGLVYQTAQHPPRQRRGDPVPAGETVHSGGTLAVIIGDTARKVPAAQ